MTRILDGAGNLFKVVMKYFENNKIYSSLSDSKKVCISNILKTQGAKIVFTNLELLIEFKSKRF